MSYVSDSQIDFKIEELSKKIKQLKDQKKIVSDPIFRLKALESKVQRQFYETAQKINLESSNMPEGLDKYKTLAQYLSDSLSNLKQLVENERDSVQVGLASISRDIIENEKFLEALKDLKLSISLKEEELKNESSSKSQKRKPGQKPVKIRDSRNYDQDSDK